MKHLQTYWFNFKKISKPTPLNFGCGVTAYDEDDAINIIRDRIYSSHLKPEIVDYVSNVRPSQLERNHVLPNIGNMEVRGVWFPQGYEEH